MLRLIQSSLCAACAVAFTLGVIGCGASKAKEKPKISAEDEEKIKQWGKEHKMNMVDKGKAGAKK
jgi:hypothetical protein